MTGASTGTTIRVGSLPDAGGAAALRRGVDRVLWQHLTTSGDVARADVYAVSHRRPRRLQVTAATALGLLEDGVPTIVRSGAAS